MVFLKPIRTPADYPSKPGMSRDRKWMLSKMLPKTFGDKTEVIVASPNGGPAQVERVIIPTNDPIEAARVYQKFMSGD